MDALLRKGDMAALLLGPGTLACYDDPEDEPSRAALVLLAARPLGALQAQLPAPVGDELTVVLDQWSQRHRRWLDALLPDDLPPGLYLADALDHAVLTLLPGPLRSDVLTMKLLTRVDGDVGRFPERATALLGPLAGDLADSVLAEAEWQAMLARYRSGGPAH